MSRDSSASLPGGLGPASREPNACPSPCLSSSLSLYQSGLPGDAEAEVAFDGITVFYFPRCQGFTSVPSRGGCTLGPWPPTPQCLPRQLLPGGVCRASPGTAREAAPTAEEEKLEALRWKVGRLSPWPLPAGLLPKVPGRGIGVMVVAILLLDLGGPWG